MNNYPLHLYLLKRPAGLVGYDEMAGCVVAAVSATHAREIAAEACGDEGDGTWMAMSRASCDLLAETPAPDVRAGIVLRDFRAG